MNPGWGVALALISCLAGAFAHWLLSHNDCAKCGIVELKAEIERQSKLIRALAEKVGITVPEQLQIERT